MLICYEVDTSNFALSNILSPQGDDKKLHLVAFHSRKFDDAEINYEIHDKELLAILDSFAQWRHFLEGSLNQVTVFSDHKNLAYLQNAHVLNRRQARWAQFSLISTSRLHIVRASNRGRQMHYHEARI